MYQLYHQLHWADGGAGAEELAKAVVKEIETSKNNFTFIYPDEMPLWDKMETIAKKFMAHHLSVHPQILKNK